MLDGIKRMLTGKEKAPAPARALSSEEDFVRRTFFGSGFEVEPSVSRETVEIRVTSAPEKPTPREINKLLFLSLSAGAFLARSHGFPETCALRVVCPKGTPTSDVARCLRFQEFVDGWDKKTEFSLDPYFD